MDYSLLLYNGKVVTPSQTIDGGYVLVRNGHIEKVGHRFEGLPFRVNQVIDLKGKWLLPGIIDIHTDAIEKEISPRPGANFPIEVAFRELERRMSGCGITTVYHSMYLGYYLAEQHSNFSRHHLFETMAGLSQQPTILRNKIHLRYEIPGVAEFDRCLSFIHNGWIDMVSFMDHTPGQGQYGEMKYRKRELEGGKSVAEVEAELQDFRNRPRLSKEQMQHIIDHCKDYKIPVASHDDDHPEKVSAMFEMGATICEFPITYKAAQRGAQLSMPTVGGASNVLRGGSLSGNLNILEGILDGVIDTLCSDYYPPALLHAIFKIERETPLTMSEVVKLTSLNPAKAAGLAAQTGSIESGKWADLIVVDEVDAVPVVHITMVGGKIAAQADMVLLMFNNSGRHFK